MKDTLTELYETKDMERFVCLLESVEPPKEAARICADWQNESFKDDQSLWDDFYKSLTENQLKRIMMLDSSERQRKYLLNKAQKKELSKEELSDLKACDF